MNKILNILGVTAIVIDHYTVENCRIGLADPVGLEILFEEFHSRMHLGRYTVENVFCLVCKHDKKVLFCL